MNQYWKSYYDINAVKFAQFSVRLMKLNRAKGDDDQERFVAEAVDAIIQTTRSHDGAKRRPPSMKTPAGRGSPPAENCLRSPKGFERNIEP